MFSRILAHTSHHLSLAHVTFADVDPDKEIMPGVSSPSCNTRSENTGRTSRGGVPDNALALDSAASVSIIKTISFLARVWNLLKTVTIHCGGISTQYNSAGSLSTNLSHLPLPKDGYIVFPNGVANLISLATLAREFRVLYNSSVDDAFYVFHDNSTYIKFTKQANGLYIYIYIYCSNSRHQ